MAAAHLDRRLLAILAADLVGYSRLMEWDEPGTIARLKAVRASVTDPLVAEHRGRIVKLMGDGAIVVFESVVDAVTCAVAVQDAIAARNPAAKRNKNDLVMSAGAAAAPGRLDRAKTTVAEALRRFPDLTIEGFAVLDVAWAEWERQRLIETMRKAGFPACAKQEELKAAPHLKRLPECPSA